jgi:hypothetical protein
MKELLMILQQKCIKSDIQIVTHHFITSSITLKVIGWTLMMMRRM